ncbi:MAG: type II secretion system protein I [Pseudomonadales bacterium]|jgi:type II secretion system protein I
MMMVCLSRVQLMISPWFKGFTLIEVLVALLIVSLVATGAFTAVSNFADQRVILTTRFAGHWIAWNKLAEEYQVSKGWVDATNYRAQTKGKVDVAGQQWHWFLTKEKTLVENFHRYEVKVFSPEEITEVSKSALSPDAPPSAQLALFLMDDKE